MTKKPTLVNHFNPKLVVAWYDLWVGAYIDTKGQQVYVMIPIIGVKFSYLPLLDVLWAILPLWLGTLITKKTGYVWGRSENDGKSFRYWVMKERDYFIGQGEL